MSLGVAGILGGLGPMATVYFMERVIALTEADTDQGHVDMIVLQRPTIPDRTAYLVGASDADPLPAMIEAARTLEQAGADFIAMPCNTAHHFYDALADAVAIPFLNIVDITVSAAQRLGPAVSRLGVLATDGTMRTSTYQQCAARHGIGVIVPEPQVQADVMEMIYAGVKAGRPVPEARFRAALDHLREQGCEAIALGCTELSILARDLRLADADVVDSVDSLARATIVASGRSIRTRRD